MSAHLNKQGEFQSDKHPDLPPDRIRLNFKNKRSHAALTALAVAYEKVDPEFAAAIFTRLRIVVTE